ncbi:hypothetical protein EVAR_61089_1 [Eumeta japonica]|uniref:Reverse transcriptase domain-containing protein n=1 Tax=Eumeta variegata TaxID=151549 RepID=A0A4C1YRN7_EUMVA|nr:hypothetical protein EVAR_61089_1 [Eumeta japonica]
MAAQPPPPPPPPPPPLKRETRFHDNRKVRRIGRAAGGARIRLRRAISAHYVFKSISDRRVLIVNSSLQKPNNSILLEDESTAERIDDSTAHHAGTPSYIPPTPHVIQKVAGEFSVKRRVRQGDPLSPKLFSADLEHVSNGTHGLSVNGKLLNHLRFADDLILLHGIQVDGIEGDKTTKGRRRPRPATSAAALGANDCGGSEAICLSRRGAGDAGGGARIHRRKRIARTGTID